jgi:hypothetical protein
MIPVFTARGKGMLSCRWSVICCDSNHCSNVTIKLHSETLIGFLFGINDEEILQTEKHDVAGV